jgi:MoaA/NifB/PqqE/SkfB family radical SAM enzyme
MDLINLDNKYMTNIEIDLTTQCNLRCRLCSSAGMVTGPKEELDIDVVRKIFHDINHPATVNLLGGEPFFYLVDKQDLYDDLFNNPNIHPKFTTNGILLKKQDKLLEYMQEKKWQINFSIDGYGEVYEHLRVGAKWEDAINSVKLANDLRLDNKNPTYIAIQYIATKDTIKQLPDFLEIASEVGADQVGILHLLYSQSAHNAYGTNFQDYTIEDVEFYKKMLQKSVDRIKDKKLKLNFSSKNIEGDNFSCLNNPNYSNFTHFVKKREIYNNYFCKQALIYVINTDGAVTPCCGGRNLVMGNCKEENIYDIWNGENFQKLRSDLLLGEKPLYCNCTAIHASNDYFGGNSSYRQNILINKYTSYIKEFKMILGDDVDNAIQYLEDKEKEVNDFNTDAIMIWNHLAGVYLYRKKDYQKTEKYCKKILKIKPNSEEALMKMANMKIFTEDFQLAIFLLNKISDRNSLKFYWLGYAHEKNEDFDSMLFYYNKFIQVGEDQDSWGYKHALELVQKCQ